jgi:hypothetical protein
MKFFRAWEKAAKIAYGWKVLAGTFDPENKKKIDLQGKDESAFTIVINDKDHLTLSSPAGYDALLTKIGTVIPPK